MYLDFRALVTQRIYMLIQGYVDTNGAYLLKYDPLFSVSKKTTDRQCRSLIMMHTWLYKRTERDQRTGQRNIMIQLLDMGYPHSNTPDKRLKTWGFQLKGSIEMWITTLEPRAKGSAGMEKTK